MRATVRSDQPSYVGSVARTSVAAIALTAAVSNSELMVSDDYMASWQAPFLYEDAADRPGSPGIPMPSMVTGYSRAEAAEVLSRFISALAQNMQPAPAEAHRAVADRPWDFV